MAAGDVALNILVTAKDSASGVLSSLASGPLGGIAKLATLAGGALLGIGVASIKAAGDFQQGMTQLVTTAGESASNIKMVSDGILKLSVDTSTSTKELSAGMYMVESSGYHGAAGLNVLRAAAQGAKSENASLGSVSDALTTIMHDYGMAGNQATNAMNGLITAVASGKTHLEDMSRAMGSVLPLAASLHVSFPQVAGAMSVMTNAGMSAQRAAQNLAFAIRSMAAPNGKAVDSMHTVGLSAQQLKDTLSNQGLAAAIQLIEDHVGKKFPAGSVEAVSAFKDIMGGAVGYNVALMLGGKNMQAYETNIAAITASMKKGGDAIQGWDLVQNNFNFKIGQMKEAFAALLIILGQRLIPIVNNLLDMIVPLISGFSSWIQSIGSVTDAVDKMGFGVSGTISKMTDGVMQAFSVMTTRSVAHTLTMKLQTITHTQSMAQANIAILEGQKKAYERIANETKNVTLLHLNELKIQSIDSAIKMNQGVVANAQQMSQGVTAQMNAMVPQAHAHMLQMHLDTLNQVIETKTSSIAHLQSFRDQLDKEMARASNDGTRHMIELKIHSVDQAIAIKQGVLNQTIQLRTGVVSDLKQTQIAVNSINANPIAKITDTFYQVVDAAKKFLSILKQVGSELNTSFQSNLPAILSFIGKAFKEIGQTALNMSPAVNLFQALARHAQELGKWFQTSVVPAIKQAEPGFKNLGQAIAGLLPAMLQISNVVHTTFQKAFDTLLPVFEKLVPIIIKLAGQFAGALGSAIKFLTPYLLQAVSAIGKFVDEVAQRVAPIMMKWIADLQDFLKVWKVIWPLLVPILEGIWNEIVGIIKIAWAILSGIIKVGLDLMSGNWGQAWTDIQDMFKNIWDGITTYFQGAWETISGIVVAMVTGIQKLFKGLWDELVGHSIVPDIVSGIVSWFTKLGVNSIALITKLVTGIKTWFGTLASFFTTWFTTQATNFGNWSKNLMTMFTSGMTSGMDGVKSAATGVANTIKSILGIHSPAQSGPLSVSDTWMPNLMKMLVSGVQAGTPNVTNAVTALATSVNLQMTQLNQKVKQQQTQIAASMNTLATSFQSSSTHIASILTQLNSQTKDAINGVNVQITRLSQTINGVSQTMTQQLAQLKTQMQNTLLAIDVSTSKLGTGIQAVSQQLNTFTSSAKSVADTVSGLLTKMNSDIQKAVNDANTSMKSLNAQVKTTTGEDIPNNLGKANAAMQTFSDQTKKSTDQMSDDISKSLDNLANTTFKNFVSSFDNLRDQVVSGAQKMAQDIANLLGHTSPKLGPLKDDDKWGDHFVDNIVGGLKRGIPRISAAANLNANALSLSFLGGASNYASLSSGGRQTPNQPVQIRIDLDGKTIGKCVTNYQGKELHVQGGLRNK